MNSNDFKTPEEGRDENCFTEEYVCDTCEIVLNESHQILIHNIQDHGKKAMEITYDCSNCYQSFLHPILFMEHLKSTQTKPIINSEEIQIKTENSSEEIEEETDLQCEKCYSKIWTNNFEFQEHKQNCPLNNIIKKEEKTIKKKFVQNQKQNLGHTGIVSADRKSRRIRKYRTKWEFTFLWVRKDEFSQDAYCTVCNLTLAPKHSSLRVHDECKKHKNNLESGSSYAKLEASPAVAKAKFREEWMKIFPWISKDQSGNPGLAFCTACARSLPAVKYTLRKHEQKIKHIRRAEEHSKMVQKSKFLKMKNSSNQFIQRPYKTRLLPSLPSSISVTQYKAKNSSDMFLKSQQNFREIVNFTKKTEVKPKTKLFSCLSCQTKFGSILNLIQHVDKNQKQNCKTAYVEANQYEDLKKQGKIYTEIQKKDQQNKFVKRRYRPEWEQEFPFITQSLHKSEPQAYCKICQTHVVNKKSYLRTHMGSVKHKKYSTQRQWA